MKPGDDMNKRRLGYTLLTVLMMLSVIFVSLPASVNAAAKFKIPASLTITNKSVYKFDLNGYAPKSMKWSSSDKSIVFVTKKGKLTAKTPGKAIITATIDGKKYTCKIKVKTLRIAHRGYSSVYTENTIEAFKGAVKNGFDGIECDVWESNNGDLMISHDATLKRTTGKNKYIWQINKSNRSKYPIINAKGIENYKGKKLLIPTLQETARFIAKYKCRLMLHIKTKGSLGYKLSSNGIRKIIKIIKKYKITSKTTIFTRNKTILSKFFGSKIKLGAITTPDSKLNLKQDFKWCMLNKVDNLVILSVDNFKKFYSVKHIKKLSDKYSVDFGIYTTNTFKEFEALQNYGALFSMSDYYLDKA